MQVYERTLNDQGQQRLLPVLKSRKMHTMTAVYDLNMPMDLKFSRMPWVLPQKELQAHYSVNEEEVFAEVGIYVFGGFDADNKCHNDLFILKPDYFENKELITTAGGSLGHFKKKLTPHIRMILKPVKTHGVAPIARFQHAACYVQNEIGQK